jgi:neuralized-like protein 4
MSPFSPQTKKQYGPDLDSLQTGHTVGVMVDDDGDLHLYTNGLDEGVAAREVPWLCYPLVDIYG